MHKTRLMLTVALASLAISAWGGSGGLPAHAATLEAPPEQKVTLNKATFARKLGKNQEPISPTDKFEPTQQVNLSLTFKGRPTGVVSAGFYFHDQLITDATVDMTELNAGTLSTPGQNTYVGFTLTPDKNKPLPISAGGYRADVTLDEKPLGSFEFKIVPPAGAVPTRIGDVTLAKGATDDFDPIDPTTEFGPDEAVYLVGAGNLGKYTWLEARWYEDGALLEEGTRTLTVSKDQRNAGFNFFYLPEDGWNAGEHEVALIVNDEEVGRYAFTISEAAGQAPATSNDAPAVVMGELETYKHPKNVFTLDVPSDWARQDNSAKTSVNMTWVAPSANGFIVVSVQTIKAAQSLDELAELGKAYLEREFGGEPAYEVTNSENLTDDIVGISWLAEPEINGETLKVEALTMVQQTGDKVSAFTLVFPQGLEDKALSTAVEQIVRSFTVNAKAKI